MQGTLKASIKTFFPTLQGHERYESTGGLVQGKLKIRQTNRDRDEMANRQTSIAPEPVGGEVQLVSLAPQVVGRARLRAPDACRNGPTADVTETL